MQNVLEVLLQPSNESRMGMVRRSLRPHGLCGTGMQSQPAVQDTVWPQVRSWMGRQQFSHQCLLGTEMVADPSPKLGGKHCLTTSSQLPISMSSSAHQFQSQTLHKLCIIESLIGLALNHFHVTPILMPAPGKYLMKVWAEELDIHLFVVQFTMGTDSVLTSHSCIIRPLLRQFTKFFPYGQKYSVPCWPFHYQSC